MLERNYIDFTVDHPEEGELNLRTIKITNQIRNDSAAIYTKAFNNALDNDALLMAEAEQILRSRNLLDDAADESLREDIRKEIKSLEIQLRGATVDGRRMTVEEGRKIALKIRQLRSDIRGIGVTKNSVTNNTAEQIADAERMQYFIFRCTLNTETQSTYWETFEDFKNDVDNPVNGPANNHFITLLMGVDSDYEKDLYEVKWLIRQGFMNEDLRLINSDGHFVDLEDRLVDEEGRYVDQDGNFLDKYGNRVDKDGNLLVEDGWGLDEGVTSPPPTEDTENE